MRNWTLGVEQERDQVETLLGPWLIVRIEDVGSISLPGLVAKPIVDLLQIARGAADSALLLS